MRKKIKRDIRELLMDESGVGVVEIILILVVLVALVIIFRDQITGLINRIFGSIHSGVDTLVP